ncbi:MAG TPA: HAD-IIA family hydrolase [Streptosporangiaceae bacterium]|nr:HAD-IIA family hydrolase [Streptosporangiaceae bacterium]
MHNADHLPARTVPAAGAPATVLLAPGERTPAERYDVALLDLDGVVYKGAAAVPGAVAALAQARAAGLRLAFVTNNASRSPSSVAEHLSALGVPASGADVVTSAQAAASLIAARFPAGSAVLVVGAIALRLALRERGLRPVSVAAERPVAVVQGYTPDLSYGLLTEAVLAVRAGALYIASNADPTLPTARGLQPGNGSLLQVVITATGVRPVVAGKPEPPLHAEAMARTGAARPLVVGDRLDTDIEGAVRGGADSLLVLTGVSTPLDAVLAPAGQRPTYLAAGLAGLLEPQPAVGQRGSAGREPASAGSDGAGSLGGESGGGVFLCGGWEVRRAGDLVDGSAPVTLSGSGAWIDGLRALCAAAWSAGQLTHGQVSAAVEALGPPR